MVELSLILFTLTQLCVPKKAPFTCTSPWGRGAASPEGSWSPGYSRQIFVGCFYLALEGFAGQEKIFKARCEGLQAIPTEFHGQITGWDV